MSAPPASAPRNNASRTASPLRQKTDTRYKASMSHTRYNSGQALFDNAQTLLREAEDPTATVEQLNRIYDAINAYSRDMPKGVDNAGKRAVVAEAKKVAIRRLRLTLKPDAAKVKPTKDNAVIGGTWARKPFTVADGFHTDPNIALYGATAGKANPTQLARRIEDGYSGQGAYYGRQIGQFLASKIPRFGAALAAPAGQWLSDREDDLIDYATAAAQKYRGHGAYIRDGPVRGRFEDHNGDGINDLDDDADADDEEVDFVGMRQQARKRGRGEDEQGRPEEYANSAPRVHTNQLIDPHKLFSRQPPKMRTTDDETGNLIFSHREYIRDVRPTTGDFETQLLIPINAGLIGSFPLLAEFAEHFAQYSFRKLIFRFRSLITEGNNTAAGSVMMTTQYNANEAPYASKREIENSEYSVSGKVTDTLDMGVECQKSKMAGGAFLYTRQGDVAQGNILDYDVGVMQLATQGATGGLTIGEVWAEYEVVLSKLSITGQRPLSVGDGVGLSLSIPSSNRTSRELGFMWLGYSQGMAQPADYPNMRYPAPHWKPLNTLATGQFPANVTTGLVGTLASNPGLPMTVEAVSDWLKGASSALNSFQMSPDVTCTFHRLFSDTLIGGVTLVFNGLVGAEYMFKYSQEIRGLITQTNPDPAQVATLPYPPNGSAAFGAIKLTIMSGHAKLANNLSNPASLALGQVYYNDQDNGVLDGKHSNVITTGCKIVATGQGPIAVRLELDVQSGNWGCTNYVATASSWQFTRLL